MVKLTTPRAILFGHLPQVDRKRPMQSLAKLSREHDGLFEMKVRGQRLLVLSDPTLVAQLGNPKRFEKVVTPPLIQLRELAGDGLFTAWTNEPNWALAHRVLAPAFTRSSIRDYHPAMLDVALQLARKWERRNPGETVDVTADMTRLTLETIGLCGFGYRFHSFERDLPHPFVKAMLESLDESLARVFRYPWEVNPLRAARHRRNLRFLEQTVDKVLLARKESGERHPDLLDRMLHEPDLVTGSYLDHENIRHQILTFLVAGHETTSGLLSFALHALGRHPNILQQAAGEAATLSSRPTFEEIQGCVFLRAVVQETLRMWPTAPAYSVRAKKPTKLAEKVDVTPRDDLIVLLMALHRSPTAWSEPDRFSPQRFLKKCPGRHHAYRPFGGGQRSCIGQSFAIHEATLCLAVLLRSVKLDRVTEPLQIQESLTLKPLDFQLRVRPLPKSAHQGANGVFKNGSSRGSNASVDQG